MMIQRYCVHVAPPDRIPDKSGQAKLGGQAGFTVTGAILVHLFIGSLVLHIALRWSAGAEVLRFYRHIAPLERN